MTDQSNGRINVSEDKLRAILAEFKLELFGELRNYATQESLDALAVTVSALTGRMQTFEDRRVTREEFHAIKSDLATLSLWRARVDSSEQTGRRISDRALAWSALGAAVLGSIATLIWLHG